MGRYAQGRRRGSSAAPVSALPAPPAPELEVDGSELSQLSTGGGNAGGLCTLYFSESPGGPFGLVDSTAWGWMISWGEQGPGYYRVTETGNGIDYSGEGPPSAEVAV